MLEKIDLKIHVVFGCLFVVALLNGYFFNWLNVLFFDNVSHGSLITELSDTEEFMAVVVVAPLVETYVFQHLPNIFLHRINVKNEFALIMVPSVLFGCVHFYSLVYVAMAFVGGIIVNVLYVYTKSKSKNYFLIVTGFHSLYNLYGFFLVP